MSIQRSEETKQSTSHLCENTNTKNALPCQGELSQVHTNKRIRSNEKKLNKEEYIKIKGKKQLQLFLSHLDLTWVELEQKYFFKNFPSHILEALVWLYNFYVY